MASAYVKFHKDRFPTVSVRRDIMGGQTDGQRKFKGPCNRIVVIIFSDWKLIELSLLHHNNCTQCLHYVVHFCTLLKLDLSFKIRYIIDCKPVFRLWRAFFLVLWRNSSVVGSRLTMKRRWWRSSLLHFVFLKTLWKGVSCQKNSRHIHYRPTTL